MKTCERCGMPNVFAWCHGCGHGCPAEVEAIASRDSALAESTKLKDILRRLMQWVDDPLTYARSGNAAWREAEEALK